MSRWPDVPVDELDARIHELEHTAYEHFELTVDQEHLPLHTSIGDVDVRLVHTGNQDSDELPVLMLHGVGSFSVLAVEVMSYLADRRIIALDWPGHGLSGPCEITNHKVLRKLAVEVVEGVLDELGIPVVDVIAHSLGGQFSIYCALDIPRRVRRLVLLGCPGGAFRGARPIPPMMVMGVPYVGRRLMETQINAERFERFNDIAIGPKAGEHLPEEVHQACYYLTRRPTYAPSVSSYFRALVSGPNLRASQNVPAAELERLSQPTLFCWGDEDAFMPPTAAAESLVAVRNHRLLRLAGAGHAPWLNEPELIGNAIVEHLAIDEPAS